MATKTESTRPGAPNRSIDEVLNETEVGAFIARFKMPVIISVAAAILGVFSWGVYRHNKNSAMNEKADKIYRFQKESFVSYSEGKMKVADYMESFNVVFEANGNFEGIIPLILKTSDLMIQNGELTEARDLLKRGVAKFKSHSFYANFLMTYRLVTVSEDLGKNDEAIELLEGLTSSKDKILEAKLYFDLGRLYKKVGNKDKARANLNYVVDNLNSEEYGKLAKIYLEEL